MAHMRHIMIVMSQMTTTPPTVEVPTLTLGWRIKMALDHGDCSRAEIAEYLGVAPTTITRWSGDLGAPPRAGYLRQIAIRCRVPFEWLQDGVSNPGGDGGPGLPRLDSNQEPSGYRFAQVRTLRAA